MYVCLYSMQITPAIRRDMLLVMMGWCISLGVAGAEGGGKLSFTITSDAFTHGGEIPVEHTCEGADVSPPLAWDNAPAGTRSLVLIVDDPDAPDPAAPKMTWVHWVLVNLPADSSGLPEAVADKDLPDGVMVGINDWKKAAYGGPCPPIGRHRYYHKLYALDTELKGLQRPTKAEVVAAMEGHVLAEAVLMGTYIKAANR